MSGNASNPNEKASWIAGMLNGWRKRIMTTFTFFVVADRKVRTKSVEAAFAGVVKASKRVEALREELGKAVRERNARIEAVEALASHAEAFIRLTHGDMPGPLADYALAPRKIPETPSTMQQAITVEKRRRTRILRGTMGKRQRLLAARPKMLLLGPDGRPLAEPSPPPPATERITVTAVPPKPEEPAGLLAAASGEESK